MKKPFRPRIEAVDAGSSALVAMQLGVPVEMARLVMERFDRGAGYLGPTAYSLVSALTNFALPQRLIHLRKLHDEAALLVRLGKVGTEADADERLKMLSWLAVIETTMLIGDLAALLSAVERWRNGDDFAAEYLQFEKVAPTIQRRDWNVTKVWHRLLAYPGNSSLSAMGMNGDQAAAFKGLLSETLGMAMNGVAAASAFLTPELRRLAVRYRHSLSVVSPASGPIYLASGISAKLRGEIAQSIVVLDIDIEGRERVLALRASLDDVASTVEAAHRIAAPAILLAGSVLLEADAPSHRGLKAMTSPRDLSDSERKSLFVYHGWPEDEGTIARHATGDVERNMDPFYRMAPISDLPADVKETPDSGGEPRR